MTEPLFVLLAMTVVATGFWIVGACREWRRALSITSPVERARRAAEPINRAIRGIGTPEAKLEDRRAMAEVSARLAVLERIATDPGVQLAIEIDALAEKRHHAS